MAFTYSTNWMGPASMDWYRKHGLTYKVRKVLTEDQKFFPRELGPGDVWEYDEITTHYSCGRIDIRDDSKYGYDGWDEYSVAPMHAEDWGALSAFLDNLETEELWTYEEVINTFEEYCGREIRWANED